MYVYSGYLVQYLSVISIRVCVAGGRNDCGGAHQSVVEAYEWGGARRAFSSKGGGRSLRQRPPEEELRVARRRRPPEEEGPYVLKSPLRWLRGRHLLESTAHSFPLSGLTLFHSSPHSAAPRYNSSHCLISRWDVACVHVWLWKL